MDNIRIYHDKNCDLFKNSEILFNEKSYIVSVDSMIIGHFNLNQINDYIAIDLELLKDFQKKGHGGFFLYIIESYINNHFDFDKYLLLIRYDNKRSKYLAERNGYKIDYSFQEKNDGEMTMYNPYYKVKKKVK